MAQGLLRIHQISGADPGFSNGGGGGGGTKDYVCAVHIMSGKSLTL